MNTAAIDQHTPLIDTQEFLSLSSFLNYQLAGEPTNWHGILNLIFGGEPEGIEEEFILDTMQYIGDAYQGQKRRLGPLAILHPIRATALLTRAKGTPSTLDLLIALLHDKTEDIRPEGYDPEVWRHLEDRYQTLLSKIDGNSEWQLTQRIHTLTKTDGQKYHEYLGCLINEAGQWPPLASIKLADRLDNTMDLRVDLQDYTDEIHCYQVMFDILYVQSYKGLKIRHPHQANRKINGSMRLYQLYKNAVFLSLIRVAAIPLEPAAERLFYSLANASVREAQSILLHIFAYHLQDSGAQRTMLREVMLYSDEGGMEAVTSRGGHQLDGLFSRFFVYENKEMKTKGLASLYQNKPLMAEAALAFIIIFANFINDEHYTIRGITSEGIHPCDRP